MEITAGLQITPSVKLVRLLGEGGMGSVWVAEHTGLGTEVAVKFLLGAYASDPALRARFAQEASAASRVKSSHVVKVYDFGVTEASVPYLVMELLEGTDLRKLLDEQTRLPPRDVITIVTQLGRALERAHSVNVVHRDIKPENVFLCSEGGERFVKLLDFGVAKTTKTLNSTGGKSTHASETLGTPYYMSPEQFRSAKDSDFRSDLWAVGVLTYEALTGTLPYIAETVGGLAIVVNENHPHPPSHYDPSLPPAFDAWFAKACASKPADRFADAREQTNALREAFPKESSRPPMASLPTTSESHLRVSIPEAERLALSDTAFATSSGTRPQSRTRTYVIFGALAAMIAVVTFAVTRHGSKASSDQDSHAAAASSSIAPELASTRTTTVSTSPGLALKLEPVASASTSPIATTSPTHHVTNITAPNSSSHAISSSTAAASTKKEERDIY